MRVFWSFCFFSSIAWRLKNHQSPITMFLEPGDCLLYYTSTIHRMYLKNTSWSRQILRKMPYSERVEIWTPGKHKKVPLFEATMAGFRGKVDGNEQQLAFSRHIPIKSLSLVFSYIIVVFLHPPAVSKQKPWCGTSQKTILDFLGPSIGWHFSWDSWGLWIWRIPRNPSMAHPPCLEACVHHWHFGTLCCQESWGSSLVQWL